MTLSENLIFALIGIQSSMFVREKVNKWGKWTLQPELDSLFTLLLTIFQIYVRHNKN